MKKILIACLILGGVYCAGHAGPSQIGWPGYQQPDLYYIGISSVGVKNNTGVSNQTTICFPDGQCRSVTEDVSSVNKYRALVMTATATWISGTEDSGMMNGMPKTVNTWYAIYAVKSRISASKFILAGSTWAPVQSNYSVLNSTFGTNGWVYLGLIRNGNNNGTTNNVLNFKQSGNYTVFMSTPILATFKAEATVGTFLVSSTGGDAVWSYSEGMGATSVPSNISIADFIFGANGSGVIVRNSAMNCTYSRYQDTADLAHLIRLPVSDGVAGDGTGNYDIVISGWWDDALR